MRNVAVSGLVWLAVFVGPAERAYPDSDSDSGTLAAWVWGASRMLGHLESLPQVDTGKVVLTGHSRCGKAALLAGALDERFAVVAPGGSGCAARNAG